MTLTEAVIFLFAIMLAAVFGPSLANAVFAIAFINIPIFARISRASGNQIWTRDFVLASRAAGVGRVVITFNHILPNILAPIIVQATIEFAVAILAEAALSLCNVFGTKQTNFTIC